MFQLSPTDYTRLALARAYAGGINDVHRARRRRWWSPNEEKKIPFRDENSNPTNQPPPNLEISASTASSSTVNPDQQPLKEATRQGPKHSLPSLEISAPYASSSSTEPDQSPQRKASLKRRAVLIPARS